MGEAARQQLFGVYERLNDAAASGDDLAAVVAELYAPEFVMEPGESDTWFGGGTVRGPDEMLLWFRTWLAELSHVRYRVVDVHDAGDHHVVALRVTGTFKRSGIAFDAAYLHFVTMRDGQVTHLRVHRDRAAEERTVDSVRDETGASSG
jgi:ketosteroid isomerase-like protein